ncbi:MAG: LamG-like jellyroll fold domain-containing protein, partial [Planctomycetota bacterium]
MGTSKCFKNTSSRKVRWGCVLLLLLCPTLVVAQATRENVVLYLPLEDAQNPLDLSDDPATVTVHGSLNAVEGQFGAKALEFNGNNANRIEVSDMAKLEGMTALTIEAWVRPRNLASHEGMSLVSKRNGTNNEDSYNFFVWTGQNVYARINGNAGGQAISATALADNTWYHLALVFDGQQAGDNMHLYVNGVLDASHNHPATSVNPGDAPVWIGELDAARGFAWDGILDEVGIWNIALSAEEVNQLMVQSKTQMFKPGIAANPSPADKATDVPRDVVLSWTPGEFAPGVNGHIVYLSENFSDVNDGIGGITVSAGSHDPGRLNLGTTHYWRVDEVNAPPDSTVFRGDVWSFTVEPVGYPIDGANITATASSVGQADFGPEKTIDGSGLDENDLHSTEPLDMWLSGDEPLGAWIQYELDKVYKLHQMWVWNSNQIFEGLFGFGLKDVTVEYSTNGTDWAALAGVPQFTKAPGMAGYAHDTTVDFGGAVAQFVRLTATSNWGGLLPQYGLSEVRFFSIPVSAREPSPEPGTTDVHPDVSLAWRAGRQAATHNVYLSTDEQAVIEGTVAAVSVTEANYSTDLDLAATYYWRIDEVNEAEMPTTWQGDVWDLTTQEYFVVDDFEDYNDWPPHEIYTTWQDGYENPANGSQVGNLTPPLVETTIVYTGGQSMPFFYSNTGGAAFSEATRTFAPGQDWTKHGIQTLELNFHGTSGNTGQLYVKVNGVKVPYDGDASNLAIPVWQTWNIDLKAVGANLQGVSSLAIGIDGNAAAGTLYFDDIRLHPLREPEATGILVGITDGLVGYYPLDEGTGNTAHDMSGNGHDGTLPDSGAIWIPSGVINGGINIDGTNGSDIKLGTWDPADGTGQLSLALWIKWAVRGNQNQGLISKRDGGWSADNMLFGFRVTLSDAGIRLHR